MATPAMLRVVEREARVFRRVWRGSVIWNFITPVLFLGAMGLGLGGLVDAHQRTVEGLSYIQFVAPGLLAATAMQAASGESLWPVMLGTKWQRTFHAVVSTPVRAADLCLGFLTWIAIRGLVSMSAFLIVAALLGAVPSAWGVLAVPAAVLGAMAFSAPLAAFAATQDNDQPFPVIMRVGVVPLFLFSGAFFPISQLPGWAQSIAVLSPLYHAVELCRAATTGTAHWAVALGHLVVLLVFALGGAWVGTVTFTRKLAA